MFFVQLIAVYSDYSSGMLGTLFISMVIGLVIAAAVVGGMIRKLKSAVPKREANDYVKAGSLHLRINRDHFLYKKVDQYSRDRR